ncbi:MAG: FAD-dependent oxidoreductase, partial [Roseibacillus sp.]|nr:FAD-dependent oxidoreductase [Roseibacillus sp.]
LLGGALVLAFLGGLFFKGKSGWCGTFCPVAPAEKLYGQNPYLLVPNNHCSPCLGCTSNCSDFNPRVAQFSDLSDSNEWHSRYRRLFAAAFPGFVLGYFQLDISTLGIGKSALVWLGYLVASVGLFEFLKMWPRLSVIKLSAIFAVSALNLFYWYAVGAWLEALENFAFFMPENGMASVELACRLLLLPVSVHWIWKTFRNEEAFLSLNDAPVDRDLSDQAMSVLTNRSTSEFEITFLPDEKKVMRSGNTSISALATTMGLDLRVGCMMGVCGVDPVTVVEGGEHLSVRGVEEEETIARLGLSGRCRMACMATVRGDISVQMEPEFEKPSQSRIEFEESIRSVVIIGGGIGGVTAADYVRRNHPECSLHLVSKENYDFYNRISIAKIVEESLPVESLVLKGNDWFEEKQITRWMGTEATRLDTELRQVQLGSGEVLRYDRLILALGCSAAFPVGIPPETPHTFVFRGVEDALAIHDYILEHGVREVTVLGDGVSGVEIAHALCRMGLRVHIVGRNSRVMRRNLDETAAGLLTGYLRGYGIKIIFDAGIVRIDEDARHLNLVLEGGESLFAQMVVICTGNVPNVELARDAGMDVGMGVRVDEGMRTNVEGVYAVGDVAEFDGQVGGLWATAAAQGRIAALNALGGDERFRARVAGVGLKVPGIDVMSAGDFDSEEGEVFSFLDEAMKRYARITVQENRLIGAITVNYGEAAPMLAQAISKELEAGSSLERLR